MEIICKPIGDLIEQDNNPRDNDEAAPKIAESIKEFGFLNPIAITADNIIISGHTRLKAARLLGLEEVPCIIHDLPESDVAFAGIIDNKSTEYATWDVLKLQTETQKFTGFAPVFFSVSNSDIAARKNNLNLVFGNNRIPVTETEYKNFKSVFTDYVKKNRSYLGFISHILKDKVAA